MREMIFGHSELTAFTVMPHSSSKPGITHIDKQFNAPMSVGLHDVQLPSVIGLVSRTTVTLESQCWYYNIHDIYHDDR